MTVMTDRPTAGAFRASPSRPKARVDVAVTRVPALGGVDLVRARFVGRATRPHAHADFEIGVVVSGSRMVTCRGATVPAPPGSVVVFNPGEVHAGAPLGSTDSAYRSFLISAESLGSVPGWTGVELAAGPWFKSPVINDPGLARLLATAHRGLERSRDRPNVETRVVRALEALARRHGRSGPPGGPGGAEHHATERVVAYLEQHYPERIRLATLAAITGIGIFHLIRVFRRATGLPPYAYLEQIRVARAAALLREGLPVSQIAARTGFSDQSHLTRFFKRIVGVPPGRYRRSVLAAKEP
jgi:AraC-like DNA-binding protein